MLIHFIGSFLYFLITGSLIYNKYMIHNNYFLSYINIKDNYYGMFDNSVGYIEKSKYIKYHVKRGRDKCEKGNKDIVIE